MGTDGRKKVQETITLNWPITNQEVWTIQCLSDQERQDDIVKRKWDSMDRYIKKHPEFLESYSYLLEVKSPYKMMELLTTARTSEVEAKAHAQQPTISPFQEWENSLSKDSEFDVN